MREVEAETDYLATYLVQFGGKPLSQEEAQEVHQQCLDDYRQLLLDRAVSIQNKYDKVNMLLDTAVWLS